MDSITAESLLFAAEQRTGLDDWGDDWFRQPLAAWVEDLNGDVINEAGRDFFTELAVRDLMRRLRVTDTLARHPEIDQVTMPPIVYVAGAVRSGTTLFHNALALHRQAKPLLRWELMEPVPPPEAATAATDPRIAKVQASIDKRRGTPLEAMHWVNADDPEECQWGFIDFVSLLAGAAGGCMRSWRHFGDEASHLPVYENYRRLVKLLLWKNPPPPGGFLVLKAPQVTAHIDEFAQVFPEARFVAPARDPYRVVSSARAMVGGILDAFLADGQNPPNPFDLDDLRPTLEAMLAFDKTADLRVVPYPELVADPGSAAVAIFDELGFPTDPELGTRVNDFILAQRQGARVRPPDDLPEPNMSHEELHLDPMVIEFCERFGITPEHDRLTGAHP
ncbi:MAG: sulfotransferase [Acidimicrobiales bacterium]|nr:sulfotransferase [Acidimicrobiales bacterium]